MSVSPTVLVACDDLILLDEVIRHLEEIPSWRLVMSARSAGEVLASSSRPDCLLVSDRLIEELAADPRSERLPAAVVVFGRQETTAALRAALALGARGFVRWPEERGRLKALVERGMAVTQEPARHPAATVTAVWAPKGGAGATVVAAHLAGSLALLGVEPILVDLDLDSADQTSVLGAEPDTKTMGDLLRVSEELSAQTILSILWSHPLGFRAVLAPGHIGDNGSADGAAVRKVMKAIAGLSAHVVADLPSGMNPVALAGLQEADSIQLVLTPDLLALRRARDLMRALIMSGVDDARIEVILNQAGGPDITPDEVRAVIGVAKVVRVRADIRIYRAANRGELSPVGCKLLTPLARSLAARPQGAVAAQGQQAKPVLPAAQPAPRATQPRAGRRLDQTLRRPPVRTRT
jgi:Flp pilus assembly CpaE family ATPase